MKFLMKIVFLTWFFLLSTLGVFALEIPTNISTSNITETSVSISWDELENAAGYHLYFSDTPSVEILTAEKREFTTNIPLILEDLDPWTEYYFIVNWYDEFWQDGVFSEEVSFVTTDIFTPWDESENIEFNSAIDFKLSNIEVLAQNQIALEFTSPLENQEDSERIFKVVDKNNEFTQYNIINSEIDLNKSNNVIITFEELLPVDTEFKLTVISILDIQWRNLESWIESFENFIIENDKLNYVYQDDIDTIVIINEDDTITIVSEKNESNNIQSTVNYSDLNGVNEVDLIDEKISTDLNLELIQEIEEIEEEFHIESDTDLNAAGEELQGSNIDIDDISIDIVGAGKEVTTLPTTGSEHILMLIAALVFWAMAYVFKFKKS